VNLKKKIHNKELNQLWNETKNLSGISSECYDLYFTGKEAGFSIQIRNPQL
jgi:predicted transcriptional regulator